MLDRALECEDELRDKSTQLHACSEQHQVAALAASRWRVALARASEERVAALACVPAAVGVGIGLSFATMVLAGWARRA